MQDEWDRDNAQSIRDGTTSIATTGHFARDCPTRDQAHKPAVVPEPEAVKITIENVV